jgi:hypothetical protein
MLFMSSHNAIICDSCHTAPQKAVKNVWLRLVPGFLLVILPKCPFCFMAFGSSMLLCSEGVTIVSHRVYNSATTIWVAALVCLLAIAGIALVQRGRRTRWALVLAVIGSALVMTSVIRAGGLTLYYTGALLITFAFLLNTSLLCIWHRATRRFRTIFQKYSIVNQ